MKFLSNYILFFLLVFCFQFSSCSKQEKTESGIVKVNEKGIPVMQPLARELPQLASNYVNVKRNDVSQFISKLWSEENDNLSFLVAKNGQIIYEKYTGYANQRTNELITSETPLHTASVSKVLTATAVLMLIDAKKISLEQKVTTLLNHFPYPDVTIKTLLNHRSGMKNYAYFTFDGHLWDRKKPLHNKDIIPFMVENKVPLETKTDTHFSYCNTNYAILALIIEKVTGLKYPQAMKEMIFLPLQMNNTFVFEMDQHSGTVAPSYKGHHIEIADDYLDAVYGDKNIYSTPRDLLKFDKARYSSYFLNPDLLKKVYQGYSYESKGLRNYGLGIRMIEWEKGTPFYYHNGWWHGNTSSFINLRKEKVTIITLSNKYTKKTYQSKRLAALFGDYPFKVNDNGDE
jgi:CubicO group peptidase (beta-lactamase class C family)